MMIQKEGETMGYGNTEVFLTAQQREELIQNYLGKTVTVTIDRPVGFHHVTKGVHLHYTLNYGFLNWRSTSILWKKRTMNINNSVFWHINNCLA